MTKRTFPVLALMLLAPFALVGCGDSENKNGGGSDGGLMDGGAGLDAGPGGQRLDTGPLDVAIKPDIPLIIDTGAIDGRTPDAPISIDSRDAIDVALPTDTRPADTGAIDSRTVDGPTPADTRQASEARAAI